MTQKTERKSRLGWVVGLIWGGVILSGALVYFLIQFSSSGAQISQVLAEQPVIPSETIAIQSVEPQTNPTATIFLTPTNTAPPPTATLPLVVPLVTSVMTTATPAALWEGPMVVGHSVQGRPIEVWRFGRGPNQYLVIAGIHGGYELNTIELADQLIDYFSRKPEAVPTDATLFIMRSMNPDGEALPDSKFGRSNANMVDLNRSFPVEWQPDWDRDGCWDLLELNGGKFGGSEPEAVAVMAFLLEHDITAVVSYHSAAPGFYPAGDPPDPDSVALAEYLSVASEYPYPAYYTGCYMTGSLVDWALTTGAAGVDVELSTHHDTDFPQNLNLVLALVRWKP
ncbi:MAG: M14 family metallopeptidase [Chloroflexota bacterium]